MVAALALPGSSSPCFFSQWQHIPVTTRLGMRGAPWLPWALWPAVGLAQPLRARSPAWWTSCSRIPWTGLMASKVIEGHLGGQTAMQPPCPKAWMGAEPPPALQGLSSPHASAGRGCSWKQAGTPGHRAGMGWAARGSSLGPGAGPGAAGHSLVLLTPPLCSLDLAG